MIPIQITEDKDKHHLIEIETTDGRIKCELTNIDYLRFNNKTKLLTLINGGCDFLKEHGFEEPIFAKKITIYLKFIEIGKIYDIIISNSGDNTYIQCDFKK